MRFLILLFVAVLISTNIYPQENEIMKQANKIIDQVRDKYAPDKRTSIFLVTSELNEDKITIKGETNSIQAKTELIEKLREVNIKFGDQLELLPSQSLRDKIFGVVNLSVVNLRSDPDHPAELSTQTLLGTPIKVYKKSRGGYFLVQTPDNYISWLDDDAFVLMDGAELRLWKEAKKIIYTNDFGFAYSDKDKNSMRVSDLVAGNILKLISEENEFYKVAFPDGREAYIIKDEAEEYSKWLSERSPDANNIISTAYRFMGLPYLWGGTSLKGVDCSGFTKTVFFLNGLIIPRDASQQVNIGTLVDTQNGWDNLDKGDLLFFGSKASGNKKEKITHVAIYIGDGDFIHSSGRVRINSFNPDKPNYSDYRKNGFIRAKRLLNSIGSPGIERIQDSKYYNN